MKVKTVKKIGFATGVLAAILTMLLILGLFFSMIIQADAAQDRPLKIWFENKNGTYETLYVVDEKTGVNYIVVSGELFQDPRGIAIIPRYNADGSLYVTP